MSVKNNAKLTKLKQRAETVKNQEGKRQVTISKFFAPKALSPQSDDVEILVEGESKTQTPNNPTEERKVPLITKKRHRENETLNSSTPSSKKICVDDNKIICAKGSNSAVTTEQKKSISNESDAVPSTSKSSFSLSHRPLSSATKDKLQQFEALLDEDCDRKKSDETSLQDLKRKRHIEVDFSDNENTLSESLGENENGDDGHQGTNSQESESPTSSLSKFSRVQSSSQINRRTKTKYTPLEQQYLDIKEKYPDALLFVECGYKYRFFGEDAEIAARVLKIFCHEDHNFMTASIPTHRLFVHVRRLVAAGYKVGVVKQTETAALKAAGENRSAPFTRELTALYTKSTLIGEDVDPLSGSVEGTGETATGYNAYLMCVYDAPMEKKAKNQTIGIVAVQPATGDVIFDCFEDSEIRSELETRISHILPVEMLTPQTLTEKTQKLVNDMVAMSASDDDRMRLEVLDDDVFQYNKAFDNLSQFYQSQTSDPSRLQEVINLPRPVVCCLSALITYLQDFNLDKVLQSASEFTKFSTQSKFMKLPGNVMRNLELFQNQTNGQEKGSLIWVIDQTVTKFGARLLRKWLKQPLLDVGEIAERQDAVQELMDGPLAGSVGKLRGILGKMPDLEKGLCSIFYKKCGVQEFYSVCKSLHSLCEECKKISGTAIGQMKSALLQEILTDVPDLLSDITEFSSALKEEGVRANDKTKLFSKESQYPTIVKRKNEIAGVLTELNKYRREVRLLLKNPSLEYTTVLGTEYLIEVKNIHLKLVPNDWLKINSTKTLSRFHSPFIAQKYKHLNQLREQLVIDCNQAWIQLLECFDERYRRYKAAVNHAAVLDCLFSLATVAKHQGYCRPEMTPDHHCIEVEQGCHPVIRQLLGEHNQYVPNDTNLHMDSQRVMIITGPNMGGKSSYIKQVALLVIMAQMGSFVPADGAKLGIFDAVYTRMGAADEIYKGRSTFMVELQEASEIMSQATCRSLVILDELGRGTSTHDGVAIACATLQYFINKVKCFTLFVTHYQMLADFESFHPGVASNYHMSFLLSDDSDDCSDVITFLYQLVSSKAERSYGLNVARLANIPPDILKIATQMSHDLEEKVENRRYKLDMFCKLFSSCTPEQSTRDMIEKVKNSNCC